MKTALSHVGKKLLAALLLFGLSAASIAGDVALNKPATQTSTINGGTANLAVDNNSNSYARTSSELGQHWEVNLLARYSDATVTVSGELTLGWTGKFPNKRPVWRTNFGTSTLEFMLGTNVVQTVALSSAYTDSGGPKSAQLVTSSPNVVFDRVRLNNTPGQGLTLQAVTVDAQPYVDNRPNVALGKPTFQTSTLEGQRTSDIAVDGNEDWFTHTLNGPSEYWKVDLLFPYKISSISIVNRKDCCGRRILGATVQILSGGAVAYSHVINENDLSSDPYLEFTVPAGTAGDSVRVLNKPNEYLSLAEVRVNGVYSYPFPADGAPGAVMSFKSGQFFGEPGLLNGGLPRSAYAMIKGVNDAVNVSPPLAGYGAATITDSARVQNQTLVPNGTYQNIAEVSTFAFGLAKPTRIKFRAGLDTGKASSLVIDGVPRTLQKYGQWWESNWGKLNDIGWTEFVDLPAGNHTFQVYGVEDCCSSPQSFQYQISGGQWTNFSANDPVLAVRPFGDVFFTPNDQTYYSLPTFTLPAKASGGYETLFFKVRASNDAHIKLGCTSNTNVFYEIVLGGWGNTVSVMRPTNKNNESNGNDGASLNTPNLLNGNEERDFWIATDGSTNTIRVGKGTDPTQGELMSWANPPYFPWTGSNRAPLCFQFRTGWGATGNWSGIRNTKAVLQKAIDDYPSFLAVFPPPPGAGPLFDPNWVKQQWAASNNDPDAFEETILDEASDEINEAQTFPETATTLGDVMEAFMDLSNSDVTQLFHPDIIKYIKLLALPGSLENNLMMGATNKTIVINNTPVAIFSPGQSNQRLDSNPGPAPSSTIGLNSNNVGVGSWLKNNEFAVAAQVNVLLPTKAWATPSVPPNAPSEFPFDINVSFAVPLITLSSADYTYQGIPKLAIDGDKLPMKFSAGLTFDAMEYLNPTIAEPMKKILGVSAGAAAKMQVALLCLKQYAGACQVQNIKLFVQLKSGVEVVKTFQLAYNKIVEAVKYLGGSPQEVANLVSPPALSTVLNTNFDAVGEIVSTAIPDGITLEGGYDGFIGPWLSSSTRSSALVGNAMGDNDSTAYVSEQLIYEQQDAADGDPTLASLREYNGWQTANTQNNNSIVNKIKQGYKYFCDNQGKGWKVECTADAKLDLEFGLQWSNNDSLTQDPFITGYNFHASPDAFKAAVTLRLTPGWEARLDNAATFKVRIIPSWTHTFLYIPWTTLGIRASPILTSEDE